MRVRVDHGADAAYFDLTHRPIKDSAELADGIIVDYDDDGRIVGVEILDVSKRTDDPAVLKQLSFELPPVNKANRKQSIRLWANAMPDVESSMMTSVEYDEDDRELDITFSGGKTYRYFDVPLDVYADLLDAESKGKFFNENIKDVFEHNEVRAAKAAV